MWELLHGKMGKREQAWRDALTRSATDRGQEKENGAVATGGNSVGG